MKRLLLALTTSTALAMLAGCGGGSSNNPTTPPDGGGTIPPTATSLTSFVHTELAATSDTTQPTDINAITFTFPDDDNPSAFDDVVGGP